MADPIQDQSLDALNQVLHAEIAEDGELSFDDFKMQDSEEVLDQEPEAPEDDDIVDEDADVEETVFADDVDDEDPEPEVQPKKTRARDRIQKLSSEKRDLTDQLSQLQDSMAQNTQRSTEQTNAALRSMEQKFNQLAQYTQQIEQRLQTPRTDPKDMDEATRFKHDLREGWKKDLQEAITPIQQAQRNRALKEENATRQSVIDKQINVFEQDAKDVAKDIVLEHIPEADAKELIEETTDWVINASAAHRKEPKAFAADLKRVFDRYHQARTKSASEKRKAARQKNKQVPATRRRGVAGAKGTSRPQFSREQVREHYNDYWEASQDNFARIPRK